MNLRQPAIENKWRDLKALVLSWFHKTRNRPYGIGKSIVFQLSHLAQREFWATWTVKPRHKENPVGAAKRPQVVIEQLFLGPGLDLPVPASFYLNGDTQRYFLALPTFK